MFRFEGLDIWKLAMEYCNKVYDVVEGLPSKAQYSLGAQLRNSALSVPNNIAEGSGSSSNPEFRNFLNISIRSAYETVSALFLAKQREYLDEKLFKELYSEGEILVKKIRAFRASLSK